MLSEVIKDLGFDLEKFIMRIYTSKFMYVCVCVSKRERDKERE